jgi:hypothetical protein
LPIALREMNLKPIVFVALACLALLGCGQSGLSGTYAAKGSGTSLDFKSGNTVSITMAGQTAQGTYKIDGKQVTVTFEGQQAIFTIDGDGCLNAEGGFGKLCKT